MARPVKTPRSPKRARGSRTKAAARRARNRAGTIAKATGSWPERRLQAQLREELGSKATILETRWPDEENTRRVLMRRDWTGPGIRLSGLALAAAAVLTLPKLLLLLLPLLHGLAVGIRRGEGHKIITALKEDDPRGKRNQKKIINGAARKIAGEAILTFTICELIAGIAINLLTNGPTLRAVVIAYIVGIALYLGLEWLDDYVLVTQNLMIMRNKGILWMQRRISVPLNTAVPADMNTFLPNIGFASIDVKMIDNDAIFHNIGPIRRPSQFHQLLKRLRGDLNDTPATND